MCDHQSVQRWKNIVVQLSLSCNFEVDIWLEYWNHFASVIHVFLWKRDTLSFIHYCKICRVNERHISVNNW